MTLSVRLPRTKQVALARLAKTKGRSKSDLIRDAIDLLLESTAAKSETPLSAYQSIVHLIGCGASGGRETLSENTGRRFAALVRERARVRRGSR